MVVGAVAAGEIGAVLLPEGHLASFLAAETSVGFPSYEVVLLPQHRMDSKSFPRHDRVNTVRFVLAHLLSRTTLLFVA